MLESFNTEKFDYKKLSLEEQKSRGILGRLVGIIADGINVTRNSRKYPMSLWEKTFNDPIMQERIQNRCCFGELGHPTDREETDMEKIAVCLSEQPKKGKDGKLYGVFDILDTPNGRILKTLCDYGCNVGVSSRGSGDLYTDSNGDEVVDEDTYDCQGWDVVLLPAVKEARLEYVTESLNKIKYNKSLRTKLKESLDKASEDDKKVIKESLDTLGFNIEESLNEDFKNDPLRQSIYDIAEYFKEAEYPIEPNKWFGYDNWDDVLMEINLNPGQTFEMAEGFKEELDNYVKTTDRLAKLAKKRGSDFDYYDDPEYEIFQDFLKELNKAMDKYLKDNNYNESLDEQALQRKQALDKCWSLGDQFIKHFDKIYNDNNEEVINHHASEMQAWLDQVLDIKLKENNRGLSVEKIINYFLTRGSDAETLFKDNEAEAEVYDDFIGEIIKDWNVKEALRRLELFNESLNKNNDIQDESIDINEENNTAVDNNEAMVEELQNTLKQVSDMQEKVLKLQEKLSVSYAKERKLTEDIEKQKSAISKLTVSNKRAEALKVRVTELEKNNSLLNEQLNSNKEALKKANEKLEQSKANSISLRESIIKRDSDRKELVEKVQSLEKDNQSLNEALDSLKKDYNLKKSKYSQLLEDSNKLIEKYKTIAEKSINKYIDSKAIALGVKSEEIKNKLPQNYSFRDIDLICEDLKKYKVSINKLPFNTILNESTKIKAIPSKNDKLVIATGFDDDIDDQLLELAKYNK